MSEPTDSELVAAYLDKNQDGALFQLIQRYQIPVFRQLSYELADPDDAQQVCETVFTIAGRRLSEWPRDEGDFQSWLMTVANEVGESRRGEAIAGDSPRLVDPAVYFRQSVHQALHTLDSEDRSLLVAVDLEGQSPEDVAERMDVPVAQVTESLERARTQFTETLARPSSESKDESPAPVVEVHPGEIVDNRYRLEKVLGEGGMAKVFAAEHMGIKRQVALKTLRPTKQSQAMIRERFVREAEVLGKLAHPNFVDVSDFGESSDGFAYLVMELLDGSPLSTAVEEGPMGPVRALQIIRQVALGLEFAHAQGVVHRDIKPDNIVLLDEEQEEGFAKILDLGIAVTEEEEQGEDPVLYGTPAYMAPEQVQGLTIDGRVDIYAIGIMLFELLTGDLPFVASSVQYIFVLHLTQAPPKLSESLDRDLPEQEAIQALIDRCLAKAPEDRFPTATALREAVEELLEAIGVDDAPAEKRVTKRPSKRAFQETVALETTPKKSIAPWLLLGAAGLAGALWWWFSR